MRAVQFKHAARQSITSIIHNNLNADTGMPHVTGSESFMRAYCAACARPSKLCELYMCLSAHDHLDTSLRHGIRSPKIAELARAQESVKA